MRSGSSLLTHILNSNPEIVGYGETHLNYSSELDFKSLLFKVYWQIRDYSMTHSYVLDKVLHNHKFLNDTFLNNSQVYTIFLLREPTRTLSSILDIKPHWSEEKALIYYIERLKTLEHYAQLINSKERSLFITYDQLVKDSHLVFDSLKNFLNTREGFSEKYQTLKTTGMKGVGDSSEQIKSGRIMQTQRKLETSISPIFAEKATKVFHECSQLLTSYCRIIKESGEE
jgi:hypothetical protein